MTCKTPPFTLGLVAGGSETEKSSDSSKVTTLVTNAAETEFAHAMNSRRKKTGWATLYLV
ncbi:MAG: hypothetical protein Rhob2KO_14260 [Rhodopirellula baltica]